MSINAPVAAADAPAIVKIDGLDAIYLSGPMTGLPAFNYPAFNAAAARLRSAGYLVYNPADSGAGWRGGTPGDTSAMTGFESPREIGFDPRVAFADYARFITTRGHAIAVLPGWEQSPGGRGETALGLALRQPILDALTGQILDVTFRVEVAA